MLVFGPFTTQLAFAVPPAQPQQESAVRAQMVMADDSNDEGDFNLTTWKSWFPTVASALCANSLLAGAITTESPALAGILGTLA